MTHRPYTVSWNLTQRCNLRCTHCYLSALPGADTSGELSTRECVRIVDDIAAVNPEVLLILTGGEPLLRPDLFDLGGYASQRGFTVVLGTNGVLLGERQARLMRENGIQGASISLDSTVPARHDAFHRLEGAWRGAVRATRVLRAEGVPFSLHMSVSDWNVDELPAMIDLARVMGARVLNFFFLVRTGRGKQLAEITPELCERLLTYLARTQGVGQEAGGDSFGLDGPRGHPVVGAGELLIRAKCAPHFRRILYALDPGSPLLRNFAQGSCPAGKQYCRIMPDGTVTPCPYMPAAAGNLRQLPFGDIWREAKVFTDLRDLPLDGRCGTCEFSRVCGGCRCRAYAAYGDYLAEDPACAYQPGAYGGQPIVLPAEQTFAIVAEPTLRWTVEARARLQLVPGFARGMVIKGVERCARERGNGVITPELMHEVRHRMAARFPSFTHS